MQRTTGLILGLALLPAAAGAQSLPTDDAVLQHIWRQGMEQSQVEPLMQTLTDSIGPRLTGTPAMQAASEWAIAQYTRWGIPARQETYGTWRGWRRGVSHVDLLRPRVRSLEGGLLAWSPGTPRARPIEAPVVVLPVVADSAAFAAWLPTVRGKLVAISFPEPTCRPDDAWEDYAREGDQRFVALMRRFGQIPDRKSVV